jgi:hypothetical protein
MRHNKKRNTGLLYEFLVQSISTALVESKERRSEVALNILKRHFKPGTHLHKEFRLINSLVRTTVSSDAVAANILEAAKKAAREYDASALDREKSILISVINKQLKDPDFFDRHVVEYQTYGTIQTLLNDWRSPSPDIGQVALCEDQLVTWLKRPATEPHDPVALQESPGTSRLLMKVMTSKLNEKYDGLLNDSQKSIIKAYVRSKAHDDGDDAFKARLSSVKDRLSESIDRYLLTSSEYVKGQLSEVKKQILGESLTNIDTDTVTRFMLYLKLEGELQAEESK